MDFLRKLFGKNAGRAPGRASQDTSASSPEFDEWKKVLYRSHGTRQKSFDNIDYNQEKSASDFSSSPSPDSKEELHDGPVFEINEDVHLSVENGHIEQTIPPHKFSLKVKHSTPKPDEPGTENNPAGDRCLESDGHSPEDVQMSETAIAESEPSHPGNIGEQIPESDRPAPASGEQDIASQSEEIGDGEKDSEEINVLNLDEQVKKVEKPGGEEKGIKRIKVSLDYKKLVRKQAEYDETQQKEDDEQTAHLRTICTPIVETLLNADRSVHGVGLFLRSGEMLLTEGKIAKNNTVDIVPQLLALSKLARLLDSGLNLDGVHTMQLDGSDRRVLLFDAGEHAILIVWAGHDVPAGMISLEAQEVATSLQRALKGQGLSTK